MHEENRINGGYLRAVAVEDARRRVKDFRAKVGWDTDPDITAPCPLPLLSDLLYQMHKTAVLVITKMVSPSEEASASIASWLLPEQPEPTKYAPEVMEACEQILARQLDTSVDQGLLPALARLYELGMVAERGQWNGVGSLVGQAQRQKSPIDEKVEYDAKWDARNQAFAAQNASNRDILRTVQCTGCGYAIYPDPNHICQPWPEKG
jgi:hypothetical protein